MPKARKAKRAKAKSRPRKRSKSKATRETKPDDTRQRELLLKVVDRMGGSATIDHDDPDVVIVKQFNSPPFCIYWKHMSIEDARQEQANEVQIPTDGGEQRAAE
jgi:hypothetical protein